MNLPERLITSKQQQIIDALRRKDIRKAEILRKEIAEIRERVYGVKEPERVETVNVTDRHTSSHLIKRKCLICGKIIDGRRDKRTCSNACRKYQSRHKRGNTDEFFR